MRLILLFNSEKNFFAKFKLESTDIVLSEKPVIIENFDHSRIFLLSNFNIDRKIYVKRFEEILSSINSNVGDIIQAHGPSFFNHVFMHFVKWITSIDKLLAIYPINELVLSDFVKSNLYVPYYESEGEINMRFFYKEYDFIPNIIFENYKKKYQVRILKNHSLLAHKGRIFIRRYILLFVKLIIHLYYKIISSKSNKIIRDPENYLTIMISRGAAHTDFMTEYVNKNKENSLLFVSEGLFNYGKNLTKVKLSGINNYVTEKNYLTIFDHFYAFAKVFKLLLKKNKDNNSVTVNSFSFNFSSAITEFIIHHYEAFLHQLAIANLLNKIRKFNPTIKLVVITGEFYGQYSYVTGAICKKFNVPSFQLQNFICDLVEDVEFLNCDKILFHSKKEKDKFSYYFPRHSKDFKYWGNIRLNISNKLVKNISSEKLRIIYFSQPVLFDKEQKIIIDYLNSLKNKIGCEICIKIHPRENLNKYDNYSVKGINIIDGIIPITEYINNYDLAIIQTSAIGQQIILEGIPLIICQISESTRKIKLDFIDNNYKGCIKNMEELSILLKDYDSLRKDFIIYRNNLIKENEWNKNIDFFNKKIKSFLNVE